MTRARRRKLEARAYPDPFRLASWRRTSGTLLATASALGVAHAYFPAFIVTLLALPSGARYVRRELALGALIAEAHRRSARPRRQTPDVDLREVFRRL